MQRHIHFLIALLLLFAGYATAQTVLGKMFQLGHTTTAGRPTPTSASEGSLLYDTDLDMPIYSTSTSWSPVSYWTNGGGTGTIQPIPGISTVQSTAGVGTNGFALLTNGARLDVGSGTNDYFYSDGFGVNVPTSLTVFDFVRINSRGLVLDSTQDFPSVGAQTRGHIVYNKNWEHPATTGSVFLFDGNGWGALGMGKNYGVQKKAMYLETSIENTAPHTMRLPVLVGSGVDASWVCSESASATSVLVADRPFRTSNTASIAGSASYCHTGTVAGTVTGVTRPRLKPSVCSWVYFPTDDDIRVWWGFTNSTSDLTNDTPTTTQLAAVRYSTSAGDSALQLVVCDGSNCDVVDTNHAPDPGSLFRLCIDMTNKNEETYLFINLYGNLSSVDTVKKTTTVLIPDSTASLGVFYYVEAAASTPVGFGVSNIAMESN